MFGSALLLGLLFGSAPVARVPVALTEIAGTSPRPVLCKGSGLRGATWQSAGAPRARSFCAELARGYAELASAPGQALQRGQRAALLMPGQAAATVLIARSHAARSEYSKAWDFFEQARSQRGFRLDDVSALHEYARAARLGGGGAAAASAYRQVLARVELHRDKLWMTSACIEAAFALSQEADGDQEQVLAHLHKALGFGDGTQFPQILRASLALFGSPPRSAAERPDGGAAIFPEALAAELATSAAHAPKLHALDQQALVAQGWEHWDARVAREKWLSLSAEAARDGVSWATRARKHAQQLTSTQE